MQIGLGGMSVKGAGEEVSIRKDINKEQDAKQFLGNIGWWGRNGTSMSKNKELYVIEGEGEKYDLYIAWGKKVGKWPERFSDMGKLSFVRKFISKKSANYTGIKLLTQEHLQYKCNFQLSVSLPGA